MASKYDEFWRRHVHALARLVEAAAQGDVAEASVAGLLKLGTRASWYGSAIVHDGDYQAAMAHMVALAKLVIETGLCARWPELYFRFVVNQAGHLTVSVTPTPPRPSLPPQRTRITSADAPFPHDAPLDASVACAQVHQLLAKVVLLKEPDDVPFLNGLYFFYEAGETSEHASAGRIVRVGNHPRTEGRLVDRLREHYRSGEGAKNASVFRRCLGGALIRRDSPSSPCLLPAPGAGHWERQGLRACSRCLGYEERVTGYLRRSVRFRCLQVDDREERNRLEARLVATLAACPVCQPSPAWLGRHAYSDIVRSSGLWNSDFVGAPGLTRQDLHRLEGLVAASRARAEDDDLSDTLLIIPCCQSKQGSAPLALARRIMAEFLGADAAECLETGRSAAFKRRGTKIDPASAQRPALSLYTGQPYATPGFRDALVSLLNSGLHCLIVSGGYGLIRPEESIHRYEAPIQRTAPVWRQRIPMVLDDYVERQRIRRSFAGFSTQYSAVVPRRLTGDDWRAVPTLGQGEGSPYREVPRRVASALMHLIEARFQPERANDEITPWRPSA